MLATQFPSFHISELPQVGCPGNLNLFLMAGETEKRQKGVPLF